MDKKILRLLVVDDSPDDVEIAALALRKAGYLLKTQHVHDLAEFQAAVEKNPWDLILSEYVIPHFGAALVVETLKRAKRDIPVIVLTRAIRDPDLIKIMHAGARDVIMKSRTTRLLPAIERELVAAAERAQFQTAVAALKEMEEKHRAVVESAREAICYCHDGMHINANKAYLDLFEYEDITELEGIPLLDLIDRSDRTRFKEYVRKTGNEIGAAQEFLAVRKGGGRFHIELTMSPIVINGEACTQAVVSDVSKRRAVENKLRYLNEHDALTGLYNRHFFLQELTRAFDRAKRDNVPSAVVYADLQDLRRASRNFGHAAADRFLLAAGRALREVFGERAILTRFGDHEFAALIGDAHVSEREALAARLQRALAATSFEENGTKLTCTSRVAHASMDASTKNIQKFVADLCNTEAAVAAAEGAPVTPPTVKKEVTTATPRTSVHQTTPATPAPTLVPLESMTPTAAAELPSTTEPPVAEPPTISKPSFTRRPRLSGHVRSRPLVTSQAESPPASAPLPTTTPQAAPPVSADWRARVEAAVAQEEFELNYLPIINLHGDPAEYFEVLVRMIGDDDQRIPAAKFMPVAEQANLGNAIDRWVVRRAIRACADLHQQQRKATFFINLSATALHDVDMVIMIQRWLNESSLRGKYIVLELEESAIAANPAATVAFLRATKRVGCHVCIDNFGRAVSTIAKLDELPVEYVKIDGSLVREAADHVTARTVLKETVDASKTISAKTIAKSVESAAALSVLWTLGLDYAQGHYFQQADASADYQFGGGDTETTLSSDEQAPHWATRT